MMNKIFLLIMGISLLACTMSPLDRKIKEEYADRDWPAVSAQLDTAEVFLLIKTMMVL